MSSYDLTYEEYQERLAAQATRNAHHSQYILVREALNAARAEDLPGILRLVRENYSDNPEVTALLKERGL